MQEHIEDKILLYRIKTNHDADAFGLVYDKYVKPIYRFVFFKLSDSAEAEDITSETFLKAWQYLINESTKEVRNVKSFLYSIARNKIIDVYRDRSKKNECQLQEAIHIESNVNLENEFHREENKKHIAKTLKKLKNEYQEVVFLRYVEDYSIHDIAGILDKSSATVRVTLHRAMKKLKEISIDIYV